MPKSLHPRNPPLLWGANGGCGEDFLGSVKIAVCSQISGTTLKIYTRH